MPLIPVTFELSGKMVTAFLKPFIGLSQSEKNVDTYYLGNGMKFFGRLQKMNDDWVFLPEDGCEELIGQADYFYQVVMAWYE